MVKLTNFRRMLTNQVFHVSYVRVEDENGHIVPEYLIVEPKHHDEALLSGVAILPVIGKSIGLVEIFRPALNKTLFEIPHGFIEPGETPEQACLRELAEETGIICQEDDIINLGLVAPDSGVIRGTVMLFLAKATMPTTPQTLELGLSSLTFLDISRVMEHIEKNGIIDSFTLVAILKALHQKLITS